MLNCIAPACAARRELGSVFCAAHLRAPAAQRGGWLSAERRRRVRGNHHEVPLDASNITRRLWIGGRPPLDRDLPEFDVLVLCAEEIQPRPRELAFHRKVVRVPLPDSALDQDEIRRALVGGKQVAEQLATGHRVLVTCHAGINRSSLVASLALGLVTKMTAAEIIALVRKRRKPEALGNPHFCAILHRFVPGPGLPATR